MKYCKPQQIIEKISEAQTISLPEDWFKNLSDDVSVFGSLYQWMVEARRVPIDEHHDLHNRTYVSQKVANRLRAMEKKRIARKMKLRGEDLERALSWSDANSGPHTLFGERYISGEVLIVLPTNDDERVLALKNQFMEEDRLKHNDNVRSLASGENFSRWLFSNEKRNDLVGDLAKDVVKDNSFPITDNYDELKEYLESHSACSGALEALDQSWQEYCEKYPERIGELSSS